LIISSACEFQLFAQNVIGQWIILKHM
jgi:hypothetical protein